MPVILLSVCARMWVPRASDIGPSGVRGHALLYYGADGEDQGGSAKEAVLQMVESSESYVLGQLTIDYSESRITFAGTPVDVDI